MKKTASAAAPGNSNSASTGDGSEPPSRNIWVTTKGILSGTRRSMRASPLMWTAILAAVGAVCFAAKSAHLGTVVIGSIGVLWMWQDMIDEAAAAAQVRTVAQGG